ncbi:MAG: hypothetical protein OXN89_12175 [Bryobacterales bacterium]|nr:hypothetical protein [Bryobacterales bacterium]
MKIRFRHEKDSDYRLIPVSGAMGAVTPTGDIKVDLYHESPPIPDSVTHEVNEDGTLGQVVQHDPQLQLQRTLFVGMVLNARQADNLGRWLQARAHEAAGLNQGAEVDDDDQEVQSTQ